MAEPESQPVEEGGSETGPHARSWFGSAPENDELVGRVLSATYRITRVLGEGGMGRVYEAEHTRLTGKRFAIKVLHHALLRHHKIQARFEREAEAMSLLDHRNIVGVYDVDRAEDGRPFMVCEYLEGRELGEHLDEVGKLTVDEAVHIARQLCRALSVAHDSGVTHRDMKPENVFLVGPDRRRPEVKLLDFGLARLESAEGDSLTQAGTIMGTPSYMAPEQAQGSKVDGRADIYAVGAILYRALTGRRPYEREDPRATLAAVLVEDPPRPRSIDPKIPEELEIVIQTAMARDPAERYPSADDLDDALAKIAGASALATPLTMPPPRSKRTSAPTALVTHSRSTLVMMVALAFLWAASLLVSASVSVLDLLGGRAAGEPPPPLALGVIVVCVLAVLASPLVIGLRHLRHKTWDNALKVSRAVRDLGLVVAVSMGAYGASALAVRLVDAVAPSIPAAAAPWGGWPLVLFVVAVLSGGTAAWSRRLGGKSKWRPLAVKALGTAALLLAGAAVWGGFWWRAQTPSPGPVPSPGPAPVAAEVPPAPAPEGTATATASASASVERASASELTRALGGGVERLAALAERYPDDVAVLRALVELYAKEDEQHLLALDRADALLKRKPELSSWSTIRVLVLETAQAPEPMASRAFELMATRMGRDGADLLYDLMVAGNQSARERAKTLLAHDNIREAASPEIRIAYDLKRAETCQEQLGLLDRAVGEGDARAAAVLSYTVDGARRGCGPRRRSPCPAKCTDDEHQAAVRAAITKIRERAGSR